MPIFEATRRDLIRFGGGAVALSAMTCKAGTAPARRDFARGIVFEDRSGAGQRQPGDPGIPGVKVSNGRDIVVTDAMGRYELPIDEGSVVFVIKPAGWSTPLDPSTKLPRFYRIHQPFGSPRFLGLQWQGIEPTGAMPESLDFPLRRAPEPDRFDVIMLADPQPSSLAELDYFRDSFFELLAGSNAAFALTLGDVVSDELGLYDRYNQMLGQVGVPFWNVPGNHDLNYEASDRRFARETWKRVFGPPWYAFEYGGATFIMLDNVDWRRGTAGARYRGEIGDTQLAFVRSLLAHTPKDRLIVLGMHIPLVSADGAATDCNTIDRDQLIALLEDRPCVSFSGHMHVAEHHYLPAGRGLDGSERRHHHQVLAAVSGSWWSGPFGVDGLPLSLCSDGAPNGFYVLSIDGTRYSTRFVSRESSRVRVAFEFADQGLNSDNGSRGLICRSGEPARVFVNLFDGGPKTLASLILDGREPLVMRKVEQTDPFARDLFARNRAAIKAWVEPCQSTHLWMAELPKTLTTGYHRLGVDVRDEFGDRQRKTMIFEVKAA